MALIDIKSDLSKFRSDFKTPSLENKVNASKYNIDEVPAEFSANGARPSKLDTFDYKKEISMGNSKFAIGTATLINQLGNGSPFRYLKNNALTSKIFSVQGYSTSNTYNSVVASISGQSNKSLLYAKSTEQNSPSAIDEEYKKYNLRDESHNTTYMQQPYILRGIQRKGNEKPQYWGFGSKSGFDDGLIRGGAVTVADRIVADTARIAKFMASPKGLLWIVKQIGLGLTNPKVETIGGPLTRQTRIHTGVASLLSVPGTALGLHFTRHGIPFANELASYENVSKIKNGLLTYSVADPTGITQPGNRLIGLRRQLGLDNRATDNLIPISAISLVQLGMPILSLSGLSGPQSVYGIGITNIKRHTVSTPNSIENVQEASKINPSSNLNNYAGTLRGTKSSIDLGIKPQSKLKTLATKLETANYTPGAQLNSTKVDLSTSTSREKAYKDAPSTDINSYLTLAYNKIPKNKGEKSFRDFRNDIDAKTTQEKSILGTGTNKDYYTKNNLEAKYGFGTPGAIGADRTDPSNYIIPGDKYLGKNRTILIDEKGFRGDKVNAYDIGDVAKENVYKTGAEDFIKFYFEDGDIGSNVMVFRCTMNGFSDSFSPGWNRIDIMGRPDGAYLYTSFERSVSFNFTVNALSRAEMVPMWRKLNYLASYTMPDFTSSGTKPGGPFMRITIGSLFQQTPGFIESLTYTIPDETTWDIAEDSGTNANAKQLPLSMDVSMTFKVIGDYRPQLKGRVYSLSPFGGSTKPGNWLSDAEPTQVSKEKKAKQAKTEADKPKTRAAAPVLKMSTTGYFFLAK